MKKSILLISLTAACGGEAFDQSPDPASEQIGQTTSAVRGGTVLTTVSGVFEAVGRISGCTATLISPYAALTAAHCGSNGSSKTLTLENGRGSITGTMLHHPKFGDIKWLSYDYALIKFPQSIYQTPGLNASGIRIPKLASETLGEDEWALMYGYGRFGSSCQNSSDEQPRYAYGQIDDVDEDWHYRVRDSSVGSCPGDSGGPLFHFDGDWMVVGVTSWGDGIDSFWKSSHVAYDWIKENSQDPSLPGDTWGGCVYYKDAGAGGAWLSTRGNQPSLVSIHNGNYNQSISSIWVRKGYRAEVYDYTNYSTHLGSYRGFSGTKCDEHGCLHELSGTAANNDASSLKCALDVPDSPWGNCILYDRKGDGAYLSTRNDQPSFTGGSSFWNNRATQLFVKAGHSARLYPSANYANNLPDHQVSMFFSGNNGDWCNSDGCLHDLVGTHMENAASSIDCD